MLELGAEGTQGREALGNAHRTLPATAPDLCSLTPMSLLNDPEAGTRNLGDAGALQGEPGVGHMGSREKEPRAERGLGGVGEGK